MQFKMIFLVLSFVSLIACSSTPEISQPTNTMGSIQKGFTLAFPDQDEWSVAENNPYKVVMTKHGDDKNERYLIQALVVKLPKFENDNDFMTFITQRMKTSQKKSGVKVVEQNIQLIEGKGQRCVQYNSKEEHAGKAKPVMLEVMNFTCRHTEKENAGVYLAYSKRYSLGNEDKNFNVSAESLFRSMELVSF